MRRVLVIEEQFGLFKIRHDGWTASGATLESALIKAWRQAQDTLSEPVVRNQFDMAEVLEALMGPKSDGGGQIHEGVLSG